MPRPLADPTPAGALPSTAEDREATDFGAGASDAGIYLGRTSAGPELILTPTVAAHLGDGPPSRDWFSEAWKEGGSATADGSAVTVDGAKVGYHGLFGSNRSLEFVATFHKRPHQHCGFGTDFKNVPWITFSTKFGHSLYARSNFLIPEETRLSPSLLGKPHRFRIDWNILDIDFWVDGRKVAYQLVPMPGYMRPLAGNASQGDGALQVEWFRMTPYAEAGTFVSRVHDAGRTVAWQAVDFDADVPEATTLLVDVRAGDTAEPGPGWGGWVPLTGVARVNTRSPVGRWAQYRLRLATTHPSRTPTVRSVILRPAPVRPSTGAVNGAAGPGAGPDPAPGTPDPVPDQSSSSSSSSS